MRAMPILIQDGKFLELRNSADTAVLPAMELKSGEDMREAAKRAADHFFGLDASDAMIREGFQARVGSEVVALYPVDASKMDMTLLRPAEEAATWAWKNVPESMGHVVALGFPRNLGERRNGLVTKVESFAPAAPGFPSDQHPAPAPGGDSAAVFSALQASVAAKTASLRNVAPHERPAREAELEQEREDLRLMAEDLGIDMSGVRMNAADVPCEKCGKPSGLDYKPSGNAKAYCESCWDSESERMTKTTRSNAAPVTARALIKQNDGTIIAARQKDGRSLLPGGHLENGETPEAAVARELQEELGLDISQALTGDTYDFEGDGLHRVFVVDGSKLDLSKLNPGDDVEEAEIQNSPFTDSHGIQHPGGNKSNDAPEDAAEAARLAEGVKHVSEDIQEGVESDPSRDAALMHDLAEGIEHESKEITEDRENGSATCNECGRPMTADGKGGWTGHAPGCQTPARAVGLARKNEDDPECQECHSINTHSSTCSKYEHKNAAQPIPGHECIGSNPDYHSGEVKAYPNGRGEFFYLCDVHKKAAPKLNDLDAGSHGHEYPGKMDGPFPIVRCNGADTVATQETMTDWRCEVCGEVISGPPKAAQVLDA